MEGIGTLDRLIVVPLSNGTLDIFKEKVLPFVCFLVALSKRIFSILIFVKMKILDNYSKKILRELQLDSRRSVQELSSRVGLSGTPCWRRVKEMEESGLIRRYTVLLDRQKLGLHVCCLVHVNLQRHIQGAIQEFERAIGECPEVVECFSATGEADYLLKVIVPDIKAFDSFLNQTLFVLPGVANVRTSVVLREVKYETALPV